MSLLNDALRAAEQRQNRPDVASVYTGQAQVPQRRQRWWLPVLLLLIVMCAAAAFYYGFLISGNAEVPTVSDNEHREYVAEAPVVTESVAGAAPEQTVEPAKEELTVVPPEPSPASDGNAQVFSESPVPADKNSADPVKADGSEQVRENVPASSMAPVANPVVKQVRETPETVDLRVSRQLMTLLDAGDSGAAEQLLLKVAEEQTAPVSREVFARAMLVQEMPDRALRWLSGDGVQGYPSLRLLRARALLSAGDLGGALATLLKSVPPVKTHIEYRVTLATLLQQDGQSIESARHWSALITVDDSRAAWWVGLAIALESRGELGGAIRAYGQAAQLPGLSPSLAEYVRERLNKLQAG